VRSGWHQSIPSSNVESWVALSNTRPSCRQPTSPRAGWNARRCEAHHCSCEVNVQSSPASSTRASLRSVALEGSATCTMLGFQPVEWQLPCDAPTDVIVTGSNDGPDAPVRTRGAFGNCTSSFPARYSTLQWLTIVRFMANSRAIATSRPSDPRQLVAAANGAQ
jgi:hypothetical protein